MVRRRIDGTLKREIQLEKETDTDKKRIIGVNVNHTLHKDDFTAPRINREDNLKMTRNGRNLLFL